MPHRLAGTMAILVFVLCLLIGGFSANNAFGTVVYRALVAMGGTFIVGFVIGLMAQKMIEDNIASAASVAKQNAQENHQQNSEKL